VEEKCIKEWMKEIKHLDSYKERILNDESRMHSVTYQETEAQLAVEYDFAATRKNVETTDSAIRDIKQAIAEANCRHRLEGFDMSLGQGLTYLAQLRKEIDRLERMSNKEPITRRSLPSGDVEYTKLLYNTSSCKDLLDQKQKTLSALQVAKDRANLICVVRVHSHTVA